MNGQEVWSAPREAAGKLNHLCVAIGKERSEIGELHAGDIGVVAKLRDTHPNDSLSTRAFHFVLPKIPFPEPIITVAAEGTQTGAASKVSAGRHRTIEAALTLHRESNAGQARALMPGTG